VPITEETLQIADSGRLTTGTTERAVARRSSILVWSPAWIGGLWVRPAA